ncbi:MAG: ester cyclase [Hyphomicrobiales bacterium]|nr:ester cyclase [Hyphomicrobiales bacterium]
MKGFSQKFKDFPDYILGITKEIWEDRGVATLNEYYGKDMVLRMPLGVCRGNREVIANTMSTLAEFPDRQLLGEDVIWSGNDTDGMLSSHRLYCTGTNLGAGMFGEPTGKVVHFRAIADCYAINNAITDEWLVRDYGGIARQMGWTPREVAARLIADEGGTEHCGKPLTPATDVVGPYTGRGNDDEWGRRYADVLMRIMNADLAVVPKAYDRAVGGEYPGSTSVRGWDGVDRFWVGLKAAFPTAEFNIEHQIGRDDAMMPPRAALRWSLQGRHDGLGCFGKPTGADVYIMGMCHAEFGALVADEPKIRREFALYDEVAIWKQILMQVG